MESIVGSLRLGWDALLLKKDAYEKMGSGENPVGKGFLLILVVGVAIALLGLVGSVLEWATTPDLNEMQGTIYSYLTQMPWWDLAAEASPEFEQIFDRWYNLSWNIAKAFSPTVGSAALGILLTPVGLIIRWLIYGLLAYLFARWLGGSADFSQTLGVLALAVAPQALQALTLLPYVEPGNVVSIWGILCAYVGLKTVHNLSWGRALWATILPFILALVVIFFASCLASAAFAAVIGGLS
jgi:hypothetical protein